MGRMCRLCTKDLSPLGYSEINVALFPAFKIPIIENEKDEKNISDDFACVGDALRGM